MISIQTLVLSVLDTSSVTGFHKFVALLSHGFILFISLQIVHGFSIFRGQNFIDDLPWLSIDLSEDCLYIYFKIIIDFQMRSNFCRWLYLGLHMPHGFAWAVGTGLNWNLGHSGSIRAANAGVLTPDLGFPTWFWVPRNLFSNYHEIWGFGKFIRYICKICLYYW